MRRYDFSAHRLFVDSELAPGAIVACRADQANYLRNVLRLDPGDQILVFNGRDGEWRARIAQARQVGNDAHCRDHRCDRSTPHPISTTCSPP